MEALTQLLGTGVEPMKLTGLQVCLRAVVVFATGIVMLRCADKRFLSRMTALDAILGFILASMLARAINGSASFLPTLAGGFVLVFLHRACCKIAAHWERFGGWVKGHEDLLIRRGQVNRDAMRANDLTDGDLLEELRQQGHVTSPSEVEEAYIERSGEISVIPRKVG